VHLRFNRSIFGSDGFTRTMLHCKSSLQCFASLFRCLHARQAVGRHGLSSSSFQWTLSTAHFYHECLSFSLSLSLSVQDTERKQNIYLSRTTQVAPSFFASEAVAACLPAAACTTFNRILIYRSPRHSPFHSSVITRNLNPGWGSFIHYYSYGT
jgi:hypothetical protein